MIFDIIGSCIGWMVSNLIELIVLFIDWLFGLMMDCLVYWLIDWLIDLGHLK